MYIMAPISEIDNGLVYNTALVIDPTGTLSGVYRQTHLSPEDRLAGIQAGEELPVFKTEYGNIGVLLDYDLMFREAARVLTLRGAQLLFYAYSTSSDDETRPDLRLGETAIYDANYVVMAGLVGLGSSWASAVIGLDGQMRTLPCFGSCVVSATVETTDSESTYSTFTCRDPYAVTEMVKDVSRTVTQTLGSLNVACIQMTTLEYNHTLAVVNRAGELGADVVLTQEAYFPNPSHLPIENASEIPAISALQSIAANHGMTIIAGICLGVKDHANALRSSYVIIDPQGHVAGAHHQHTGRPADDYNLFDTGFGPFGSLVCWDMGPEGTRVEALKGARILFYGTLQILSDAYELILPALAMENTVPIAFSAAASSEIINPQAGVVGADGAHLPSATDDEIGGYGKEIVITNVPLPLTPELFALKQQLWNDRRPELYTPLIQSDISLPAFDASYIPQDPVAGQPMLFSASTYNTIFPMTAGYTVRFLVDGQPYNSLHRINYERWSSYPTGAGYCAWDFNYRYLCSQFLWNAVPGVHTLAIEADANGEIPEIREDNNKLEWTITVPEVNIPTPTPQPPPTTGEYPQLPSPWQYLGYFYDPLLDNGKKQTNNYLDRQELLPDAPGMELIHAGHHGGTHVVIQYRHPDGTWDWRPAVYPDKESMPDYPPVADRFSATYLVRDPAVPGAYVTGFQRSDPLGTHGLCYFSPKTSKQTGDSPYEGHALLSMTCEDGICGDPVCINGFWNVPSFFERNEKTCMLALPSGYLEDQNTSFKGTTYAVILERDDEETWASVPTNEYQYIWIQSGPIWVPLCWDPFVMLGEPVIQGVNAGTQVQACVFEVGASQYLLVAGGATKQTAISTSRGFILLYRFLDNPAPGPRMDYRVELIQTVVDSPNALPGSPAMVAGYTGGALIPLEINLNAAPGTVPDYVVGVVRRSVDDPDRWKHDFGTGLLQNVSGGFVILRGYSDGSEPRFEIAPPVPDENDYISGYGIEILPTDHGDDVLFKTSIENSFIVLRVPNEAGEFDLNQAEVLLDGREIVPSATWNPFFFSACFLGLEDSETINGAIDLVIGFSLEDKLDLEHQRHGYIVRPNLNGIPSLTPTPTATHTVTPTFTHTPSPTPTESPLGVTHWRDF
jgi:predicted amidohydrolase